MAGLWAERALLSEPLTSRTVAANEQATASVSTLFSVAGTSSSIIGSPSSYPPIPQITIAASSSPADQHQDTIALGKRSGSSNDDHVSTTGVTFHVVFPTDSSFTFPVSSIVPMSDLPASNTPSSSSVLALPPPPRQTSQNNPPASSQSGVSPPPVQQSQGPGLEHTTAPPSPPSGNTQAPNPQTSQGSEPANSGSIVATPRAPPVNSQDPGHSSQAPSHTDDPPPPLPSSQEQGHGSQVPAASVTPPPPPSVNSQDPGHSSQAPAGTIAPPPPPPVNSQGAAGTVAPPPPPPPPPPPVSSQDPDHGSEKPAATDGPKSLVPPSSEVPGHSSQDPGQHATQRPGFSPPSTPTPLPAETSPASAPPLSVSGKGTPQSVITPTPAEPCTESTAIQLFVSCFVTPITSSSFSTSCTTSMSTKIDCSATALTTTTTTSTEIPATPSPHVIYVADNVSQDGLFTKSRDLFRSLDIHLPDVIDQTLSSGDVYGWHASFNNSVGDQLAQNPLVSMVVPDSAYITTDSPMDGDPEPSEDDGKHADLKAPAHGSPHQERALLCRPGRTNILTVAEPAATQDLKDIRESTHDHLKLISRPKGMCETHEDYDNYVAPLGVNDGTSPTDPNAITNRDIDKVGDKATIIFVDSGLNVNSLEVMAYESNKETDHLRWVSAGNDPNAAFDPSGHGTWVWQYAVSPSYGVAKGARSVIIRCDLDPNDPSGTRFQENSVIRGLELAAKEVARGGGGPKMIVNLSLGLGSQLDPELIAQMDKHIADIHKLGALIVTSAGNMGLEMLDERKVVEPYKVAWKSKYPGLLLVGATTVNGEAKTQGTSVDPREGKNPPIIDVWAKGDTLTLISAKNSGVLSEARPGGTSLATPQVAGLAALFMSTTKSPPKTNAELADVIRNSAWPRVKGGPKVIYNGIYGPNTCAWGRGKRAYVVDPDPECTGPGDGDIMDVTTLPSTPEYTPDPVTVTNEPQPTTLLTGIDEMIL